MNNNPSCQHHQIDNETWACEACEERMITQMTDTETLLDAPNAAPCRDPDHLAAIESGEDFECSHPYVPDHSRAKTVVIGYNTAYKCERCSNTGSVFDSKGVTWDCGHLHRGRRIAIA